MTRNDHAIPKHATAALLMADGTVFFGQGIGAEGTTTGEICFNTSMTGYQEILTDPSYAGQIVTFTFPHIGNVGCNQEDTEARTPHCAGLITRERPTEPSNFRSETNLQGWLAQHKLSGIYEVDTRAITRHVRTNGAQNVAILHARPLTEELITQAKEQLANAPDMKGLDLAKEVSSPTVNTWEETLWKLAPKKRLPNAKHHHVVAIDYGAKHNILRSLAEQGCNITVVPAETSAEDIIKLKPDGIFLSNGPGDPEATGTYALPVIKELISSGIPMFGICLGHQLLAQALGARTKKMAQGHRGANHPVKDLADGKVIITSQNHGFVVSKVDLPDDVEITHTSLFDGTVQGIRHKTRPIFSVQGHPEASPGPHDSQYLFAAFVESMGTVQHEVKKANA